MQSHHTCGSDGLGQQGSGNGLNTDTGHECNEDRRPWAEKNARRCLQSGRQARYQKCERFAIYYRAFRSAALIRLYLAVLTLRMLPLHVAFTCAAFPLSAFTLAA